MVIRCAAAFVALMLLAGGALAQDAAGSNVHVRNNYYRSVAITPGNTPMLPTSAIFTGSTATCAIAMQLNGDTTTQVWAGLPAGTILPVQAVLIISTGTTCTGMIALYDK